MISKEEVENLSLLEHGYRQPKLYKLHSAHPVTFKELCITSLDCFVCMYDRTSPELSVPRNNKGVAKLEAI